MDSLDNNISPVVFTNKAQCRDCYRCLRQCPVKAIRMINGQASVDPEKCIACGTCIKECPQGAKQYRNDLEKAIRLLKEPFPVAVSLAPSFAAFFTKSERQRLPSALRKLGF
ncbi:MAG TPA: 4Fe-4S binding protein, partial [Candidatus Rifleibacterium sp.]|nr:4Fe-4S binding protein [Candidatus Rifleibacterium sp.]